MLIVSGMASLGQSPGERMVRYHELVPLGAQTFTVQGHKWKGQMALLASADSPQFEGMQSTSGDDNHRLAGADGSPMQYYPSRVVFRLTASFRANFADPQPFRITAADNENEYLLNLKFRIVAFHGLRQTVIAPASAEMIGVPSDLRYDERIYRVAVDLAKVPVSDRVVFEVLDPGGVRLYKFHLDLM